MFGQMKRWDRCDAIEQFLTVKNAVSSVSFVSSSQFWKFKGLALMYFAGVSTGRCICVMPLFVFIVEMTAPHLFLPPAFHPTTGFIIVPH